MHNYTISKESVRLREELERSNIKFAHWKSNSHLLKSLAGETDLDLLIKQEDRTRFESSMLQLGYKRLRSQPWSSYPNVDDWLGLDRETGKFLHVHTHYALVTGIQHVKHLHLPWVDVFFDHVIKDEQTGWPIPKPELEVLILLVRIWAKMPPSERIHTTPAIPPYIKDELINLLKNTDPKNLLSLCGELNIVVPNNFLETIDHIKVNKDADSIVRISKSLYTQMKPYFKSPWVQSVLKSTFFKLNINAFKYSMRFLGPHKLGKTLNSGGKIIALVGSDGSGKSTLSNDLVKWLTYKMDTHYFYMGKNPYIKSNNKILLSRTDVFFLDSRVSKALKKFVGSFYYLILIKKKLTFIRLAKRMSTSGSIIICDRFPQKSILGINDGPNLQKSTHSWTSRIEMNLFDQVNELPPDIVIKLNVSPDTAFERKPQHDKIKIFQKCDALNNINFKNAKVVNIDSNQPYDKVLAEIKNEIWNLL
ncbi:hypothetical protein [Pontibacter virosus]|uniref:Thymidylate kinase n=1 Tax=Pontibacter virosus TaxID=1765052 RepID=A0A2U1AJQ8_9BACT|nr:hypothetical protein [Pontibacter virosus]PVY36664.1 thymidylate kinase [Pontibacter virosus]